MANYYATARSNYFKVKDPSAFETWAEARNLEVLFGPEGTRGVASNEDYGWPCQDDDCNDVNIIEELPTYLTDGEVAVLMQSGAEKLRYVDGFAWALHSNGESERISLWDIYEVAEKRWGIVPTQAAY